MSAPCTHRAPASFSGSQQDRAGARHRSHMEVLLQMSHVVSDPPQPAPHKCVLLVDRSDESRDVIRTVLERRGVEILEASSANVGLEMVRKHRPHVVVLDADAEVADNPGLRTAYDHELTSIHGDIVVLGNINRDSVGSGQHLIRKPYHYGPLIQRIEELVSQKKVGAE